MRQNLAVFSHVLFSPVLSSQIFSGLASFFAVAVHARLRKKLRVPFVPLCGTEKISLTLFAKILL